MKQAHSASQHHPCLPVAIAMFHMRVLLLSLLWCSHFHLAASLSISSIHRRDGRTSQNYAAGGLRLPSTSKRDFYTILPHHRHITTSVLYLQDDPSVPESSSQRRKRRNRGKPTMPLKRANSKSTALQAGMRLERTTVKRKKAPKAVPTTAPTTTPNVPQTSNKSSSSYQRNPNSGKSSYDGAWYLRDEMLRHDVLSFDEEISLATKICAAKDLRDEMRALIEYNLEVEAMEESIMSTEDYYRSEDMDIMSIYSASSDGTSIDMRLGSNDQLVDKRISSTLVRDGSKLNLASLESDLEMMSDDDILFKMNIDGGREELRRILYVGAEARDKLMRSNIRLVVSIAKKWMGRNMATGNAEGATYTKLYNGSWDRPSLDEAIQEGILGLARAVDKYDPDRGLRFSTYSTYWITSYIRQCFQAAMTGCLKVPANLHEVKNQYKRVVKRYIEESDAIPPEETIAAEIGVTVARLRTAIRVTESLLSLDEPVYSGGNSAAKGSAAGGDVAGGPGLLLGDRLECTDTAPEDYVDISFLRQSLENAMAAELSPHERDILRMRLGLDDGQSRTVRQIVEECGGGISLSDVRSVERRAFKKLRSPNALHTHNLLAFMEMAGLDFDSFPKT